MNASAGIRMKRPAHPGGFVKHEIIDPLGLSVTRAAEVLGVTRATLSTLLNERAHLSPDMAVRIEKAFGVSIDTLMRMQNSYDIAQARGRASKIKVARFDAAAELRAARTLSEAYKTRAAAAGAAPFYSAVFDENEKGAARGSAFS